MLKFTTWICFLLLCVPEVGYAASENPNTGWFRDFGVGFDYSTIFQESALGRNYDPTWSVGPSLSVALYRFPRHRIALTSLYLYYGDEETSGTKQIYVKTSHQRVDIATQYDFCWNKLILGLRMGAGLSIASSTTRLKESFSDVAGNHFFYDGSQKKATGVNPGFIFGITAGLNLGALFSKQNPMDIDLRLRADYFNHGERNDLTIGVALVFWPMSILRSVSR